MRIVFMENNGLFHGTLPKSTPLYHNKVEIMVPKSAFLVGNWFLFCGKSVPFFTLVL